MSVPKNNGEITEAYKSKILAIRNYKSDKKEFLVDDFTDIGVLEKILEEIDTGESDITPAGKSFLEEYFGFDKLASILLERKIFLTSPNPSSLRGLVSWFETLEPMNTITFIEKSKDNISDEQSLREDLLPPKGI